MSAAEKAMRPEEIQSLKWEAFRDKRVSIILPDATRRLDHRRVTAALVEGLRRVGATCHITIALGLHRPMNAIELQDVTRLGVPVTQSRDEFVKVGEGEFLRSALDADAIVCVGTVEPHQYAGFSGGIKALSIGCASERVIMQMHGVEFLRDERVRPAVVEGNPFRQRLNDLAAGVEEVYALNIVAATGEIFFGPVHSAFASAVAAASQHCFVDVDEPLDHLILVAPPEKSTNFYQASRFVTYAALVDRPAVREGGWIILDAQCPEGLGKGRGEQAFATLLKRGWGTLLKELNSATNLAIPGGGQRAYVLARALSRFRLALVTSAGIPELSDVGISTYRTVEEAQDDGLLEGKGLRLSDATRIPRLRS